MALKLSTLVNLRQLGLVNLCDIRGRNGNGHEPLKDVGINRFNDFVQKAKKAFVEHGPEDPILLGRHLLGSVEPGPKMGKLLNKAYQIQIEEGIRDFEILRKRVLS